VRRRRWTKATWFARVGVVLVAVVAYIWMLPSAFGLGDSSSSSSYGYSYPYGNAYGQDLVPVCHKGKTIQVPSASVAAYLAQHPGDTLGPCP
jgi:hypothetical protein